MAEYKSLKTNEVLFNQGDEPDNMYIVKSGQIEIFIQDGNQTKALSTLGAGELIGELSLFDKKTRSAGAKALTNTSLVILPYVSLEKQLDALPDWVRITMETLCDRLRTTNQKFID